jgi:elongator complex protein 3
MRENYRNCAGNEAPDQLNKKSLLRKRKMGCTRIQLGLQHVDDAILRYNNRGHSVSKSVFAIACARDACFKVDGHLMPDLPGSSYEKDIEMFEKVFSGTEFQLDYCKIYPCLDLPYTLTREWKKSGQWKPLAEHDFGRFLALIRFALVRTPPWTRINRVHRDFPEASEKNSYLGFVSENIKSNLQQYIKKELEKNGENCYDIRSREIKNQFPIDFMQRAKTFIRTYRANNGTEFFLSVEIPRQSPKHFDDAILIGLLRLRLTDYHVTLLQGRHARPPLHQLPEFINRPVALIRELHVYGLLQMSKENSGQAAPQHIGVGRYLMALAERIAYTFNFDELCVISGVGVRNYYRKLGYTLSNGEGEYMMKKISSRSDWLPLRLFQRSFEDIHVLLPIMLMQIPKSYLHVRPCLSRLANQANRLQDKIATLPNTWFSTYKYPFIQNGAAELIVIGPPEKNCWERFSLFFGIFLSSVLLLLLLIFERNWIFFASDRLKVPCFLVGFPIQYK